MPNKELIDAVLTESEEDIRFKKYMSNICKTFGEDYATLVLSCDYDIEKSLGRFSSKFKGIDSHHVASILLQSALLSKSNFKKLVIDKINDDSYYSLFAFICENIYFRRGITRVFLNSCNKTNEELFERIDDEEKDEILDGIQLIKVYERTLRVQDALGQQPNTKRKKGNH